MVVEAGQVEERMEQDEESNNPALDGSSSAGLAPLTRPQYKPLPANEMEVRFWWVDGGREGRARRESGWMRVGEGRSREKCVRGAGKLATTKHTKQQQSWHSVSCLDLPVYVVTISIYLPRCVFK